MSKTLDQYTPEQRKYCPGMWCDVTVAGKTMTEVIGAIEGRMVILVDPNGGRAYQLESLPLSEVTPRWDLPRAWTPDGHPVPGEWEEGMSGFFVHEAQLSPNAGNHGWTHRRFVTEWEQVPDYE